MTHQEILEKAIQKAIDAGWEPTGYSYATKLMRDVANGLEGWTVETLLFNHDFAKSFFGEGDAKVLAGGLRHITRDYRPEWRERLMEMVVSDDPIKYLENYVG